MSRCISRASAARGELAAELGPAYAEADVATKRGSYSPAELQAQLDRLPKRLRLDFRDYAAGVNEVWPKERAPWTPLDSVAVTVRLMQVFGRGGAGELRNLALLSYLRARPDLSPAQALDAFDDLTPAEDPAAPTTISGADAARVRLPDFPAPTREATERQLAGLPKFNLIEMLKAARVASLESPRAAWASVASPFTSGSYAVAVAASRSTTGRPLLLSGPQMGLSEPSIGHEVALDCPTLKVSGLDVPGVPAVLVGATPRIAWGLTTGVADTEDLFAYAADRLVSTSEARPVPVRGEAPRQAVRERAEGGDVLFRTADGKTAFVRRRSYAGRELASLEALFDLYGATSAAGCDRAFRKATMNFNAFFAAPDAIGWRYTGLFPLRAPGYDPRLPLPGGAATRWRGVLPPTGCRASSPPWTDS